MATSRRAPAGQRAECAANRDRDGDPCALTRIDGAPAGQTLVSTTVERLRARGVTDEEIRRLFEAALNNTGGPNE